MNKLEMAHDYFLGIISNPSVTLRSEDMQVIQHNAWIYADAMQAEADKREEQKAVDDAESSKVFFEKLTGSRGLQQTFIDGIEQPRYSDEQWQPDWSKAPVWGKYWAVDKDLSPFWHEDKPKFDDVEFYQCGKFCAAPLFSYKGSWQDSVRKRP